jgi:signal peptidase
VTALALAAAAPRDRNRVSRAFVAVETIVLGLVVAFLVFGRAGFVGSPLSYVVVSGHSMEPTFWTGDVAVLLKSSHYRKGDVVGYAIPKGGPGAGLIIIHRIVGGDAREGYVVQGDNKPSPDPWRPRPADIVGRERLAVPKLGLLVRYVRTPLGFAALAGLMTLTIALGGAARERRREPRPLPESVAALPRADELPEWFVRLRSGDL